MSENTWALLISSVAGLLSYGVRWAVTRITKSMDASTEARIAHAAALEKQASAFTVLRQEVSELGEKVGEVHDWCLKTPAQGHRRAKTEPKGTPT